ncbi:hypothetical protein HK100_011273 [Physocladia obscura]|uniref:ABC transporter n=1 Tax=Physocladia obscura TaxID=109957 RepID=A0AAD5XGQ4_9FUNG|nr:hypothetical protein HK100_011273 [Physocladia obscura]
METSTGYTPLVVAYYGVGGSLAVLAGGQLLASRGRPKHLNARWRTLDSALVAAALAQLLLSLGLVALGIAAAYGLDDPLHLGLGPVDRLLAAAEAVWAGAWAVALLAFMVLGNPASPRVGASLFAALLTVAVARVAHIRAIAFAEPLSSAPLAVAAASLVLLAPMVVLETIQRYWQSTFVGSLLDEQQRAQGLREPCREADASFLAKLTFSWIDALLIKARSKPLEDEDVWDLSDKDKTVNVVANFRPFQWRIIVVFGGCVVAAILDFSKTFFLNRIIVFLQSPRKDQDQIRGFTLLVGLLCGQLITSTINGWVFYLARRNAINIRSTLVSEIYEKALRRSAGVGKEKKDAETKVSMFDKPDQKANIGKIVSLMSSDANRLYNFAGFIHRPLVDLPISCIISVAALLYLLGPSALAGLLVVLISGPATGLISKWMIKEQLAYASATDNRTQVINEALQGIRIIKYFGWEEEFVKRVSKSREKELSKAVKLWIYFIGYIVIAWGGSILVVFSSFFCYTVFAGHTLDPATAFTSVTLLHQVGVSLNVLPMIGMQLMRAKVSLDRIADFLKEEELEKYEDSSNPFNSATSNYTEKGKRKPKDFDEDHATERTPLLSSSSSSSSSSHIIPIIEINQDEPVELPAGFNSPKIGFYHGTFMYFGTDKKTFQVQATSSLPAEPLKKKWSFSLPWSKKSNEITSGGGSDSLTPAILPEDQGAFELRDVTLEFPVGKLSVVTGSTGSGKSSLLLSMLGELKRISGFSFLPDPRSNNGATVAYVAQQAFLLNATIRDNILFGNAYEEARYKAVIEACSLVRDLEILEGGDLTEIGEKGINMSGGQKQRISLARAAYSKASIILLDDCLSAVDAPTARHLLFKCILGPLMADKTKVLVTHATSLVLPHANYVVVLKNGEIAASGNLDEIIHRSKDLDLVLNRENHENERAGFEAAKIADVEAAIVSAAVGKPGVSEFKGISSHGTKIVDEENRSTGSVDLSCMLNSCTNCAVTDLWIKIWTDASRPTVNSTIGIESWNSIVPSYKSIAWIMSFNNFNPYADRVDVASTTVMYAGLHLQQDDFIRSTSTLPQNDALFYISVYAGLSLLGLLVSVLTRLWVLYGGLMGSRNLHAKLTNAVFGAPMRFFEKTPVGRLLNRFTKDIATIDNECMDNLDSFFRLIIQMTCTIVLILYVAPSYSWISSLYLGASRELKRLESISNSPVYAQFSETLMGVSTVRAFGSEKKFSIKMESKVDANNRNSFYLWTANRWLNSRCEYLSAVMTSVVGFAIIAAGLDPGWAGLTMIYVFEFTSNLTWLIRCHANMDMSMNAVERIDEYAAIEQEPPAIIPESRPPQNWPAFGQIEVKNLSLKYQQDLPNVLHNLTFTIGGSEKIGVVGRTGAGKSTLTLAFFRILNQFEGSIVIDGVDIAKIGLRDLRNRLTIIPQDPVLFEGTLRFNLDPLAAYTDQVIWDAVKAVGLIESMQTGSTLSRKNSSVPLAVVGSSSSGIGGSESNRTSATLSVEDDSSIATKVSDSGSGGGGGGLNLTLDYGVAESGSNFSQGQRQLICLARAILRQTKVFFLDASVDETTDNNIQQTIRTDRVLVLERGRIEEFDTPLNLINKSDGIFKKMCEESGEFLELVKLAERRLETVDVDGRVRARVPDAHLPDGAATDAAFFKQRPQRLRLRVVLAALATLAVPLGTIRGVASFGLFPVHACHAHTHARVTRIVAALSTGAVPVTVTVTVTVTTAVASSVLCRIFARCFCLVSIKPPVSS